MFLRKLCTNLAPTLTLSPNRPKWDPTWPSSPGSSIECIQNDFRASSMFGASHAPILHICTISKRTETTLATSPRSTIAYVPYDFWAYDTFGANHAPILHQDLHHLKTDHNEVPHDPRHLRVPSGASKLISEPVVCWRKMCIYLVSRLALSPNRPKWASTWASSPKSTIGCVQKDFWANGTFGTNHAPLLLWP
jgi:hypothetical protein